jgi:hypothetical protein
MKENMFVINSYMINKMGWINYSTFHHASGNRIGLNIDEKIRHKLFDGEESVLFFMVDLRIKKCYVIKEKQNKKNTYNFIICDCGQKKNKFKNIEFRSNTELLKLIIEHNACSSNYQRHFNINKILYK